MITITPKDLRHIGTEQKAHIHEWAFYDGCLGYESLVCLICGVDVNDLGTCAFCGNETEKKNLNLEVDGETLREFYVCNDCNGSEGIGTEQFYVKFGIEN